MKPTETSVIRTRFYRSIPWHVTIPKISLRNVPMQHWNAGSGVFYTVSVEALYNEDQLESCRNWSAKATISSGTKRERERERIVRRWNSTPSNTVKND